MNTTQVNGSVNTCWGPLSDDRDIRQSINTIFMLSNFVVGLPANAWVVWLICHGTREMPVSEMYILSLAGVEILYCLLLPAQLYCLYSFEHMTASSGVPITLWVQWNVLWVGRLTFQVFTCVDRYLAVVHPLIFLRLKPLRYRMAKCALAWCSFIVIGWFATAVNAFGITCFYCIMCLLLFCTLSVLFSLKRPGPGDSEQRRRVDEMKRKAFNIILVHLACFSVNYLPAFIYQLLITGIKISEIVRDLISCLAVVCGQVPLLLYLHRVGKLSCAKRARSEG